MGLEFQITCHDYHEEFYERIVEKMISAIKAEHVTRNGKNVEIWFTSTPDSMPDIAIQPMEAPNQFIFLYNGGNIESWSILGLFISYLTHHSESVNVEEL